MESDRFSRRQVLKLGGLTLVIAAVDPRLVGAAGSAPGGAPTGGGGKLLVYVFQRFGADGLNTVIPVEPSEHAIYRGFRPTLGVDRKLPGVGPLTPDFALHPVMKDGIHRLYLKGMVAVLPNVGYPDGSRSHFDSQLYLDRGTPQDKTTADGWLNRHLRSLAPSSDPLRALAFGTTLPVSLEGPAPALVLSDVSALKVSPSSSRRNQEFFATQKLAYGEPGEGRPYDDDIGAIGRKLVDGVQSVPPELPAPTVPYPKGKFGQSLSQLAQLIRSGLFAIEVAEVDFTGWDTHGRQQKTLTTGVFPELLAELSDGIAAFADDLGGERMKDILVLTASEFGRTARENGSEGTDHGSAWASFVIGGKVKGGVYFGPEGWHGLTRLREDRDLKYSLDFRDVFSEVLARHAGRLDPAVFPGWKYTPVGFL